MNSQLHRDTFHPLLRGALLLTMLCALGLAAMAQERAMIQGSFANNQTPTKIDVLVGQSRVIDFDQEYERLSVSDPKIAEAVPISFRQVLLNGLQFGQVNLVAWSKPRVKGEPSRMVVFDIFVQVNLSLIDNQIKILFPKENIQLSQANNSVVLSGSVTRPELSDQVEKIIKAAGLNVTNLLRAPVVDASQVQLQIRVAEVNRTVLREISTAYGILNSALPTFISAAGPAAFGGYTVTNEVIRGTNSILGSVRNQNLSVQPNSALNIFMGNTNNSATTQAFIRALYSRGALRDLAEPNLIAMHGQKASFLAGGEFPVPVIQSVQQGQNAITIIFKPFGVKLEFTPTIIDENHIRLEMEPEVSSLDFASGVTVQGLIIPGLRVRRAKTTLELRDGQSFALAGLIDNREQVNLSKIPLLGDIPVIGELFKSRSFQRNETELLFLATVKMVEPLNPDQLPRLPGVSELKPVGSANPAGATPASSIEGQSGHAVPRKNDGPESENKVQQGPPAVPPAGNDKAPARLDRGATASLTSELAQPIAVSNSIEAIGPVGPVAADAKAARPEDKTPPAPGAEAKPDSKPESKPEKGGQKPTPE
ncbi:MAG: pilus assembly protein N-terminal domain-containing protein [Blastocatellia bacterium]|nr:pilus assembly protein N-terminal domain-containing protein [Blastocatellia bacterium]